MSLAVTLLRALLGYPVAYLLASLSMRTATLLPLVALVLYWTYDRVIGIGNVKLG